MQGTLRVGDIDMAYELADYTAPWRESPPETILLHHGYARSRLFWQQWIPLLATEYRVLSFDARGCGGTSKPDAEAYRLEQIANDAVGLMKALGIDRVHWVGESSGGIIGMVAALEHPQRLATLTVCDTPFKRPDTIESTYKLGEATRAAAFDKYGIGGWCRRTLAYRLDVARATPALCEWYIAQMDRTPKHCVNAMDAALRAGDLWPRLPEIKTPMLVMGGENSPIANAEQRQVMRKRITHAQFATFEGYGHGVHLLAPELCVGRLRQFLTEQGG